MIYIYALILLIQYSLGFDETKFQDIPRVESAAAGVVIPRPFSATGILKRTMTGGGTSECVGAVVHHFRSSVAPPNLYTVFALTAAHCCEGVTRLQFYNLDSTAAQRTGNPMGGRIGPAHDVHVILDPGYTPAWNALVNAYIAAGYNEALAYQSATSDWCIVHFERVPENLYQLHATHSLQIKYDARLPSAKLLMSTYRTPSEAPPGQNYRKKQMETAVHHFSTYPGIYSLGHASTARGQSGSPFVHPTEPDMIRGVLAQVHFKEIAKSSTKLKKDWICGIDQAKYAAIRNVINTASGAGHGIQHQDIGPAGAVTGGIMGTATAKVSDYGEQLRSQSFEFYDGYNYGQGYGFDTFTSVDSIYSLLFIVTSVIVIVMCCMAWIMISICGYFGIMILKKSSDAKYRMDGVESLC